MNCHYSCQTCSGNVYYDLCLTCPTTRQLITSICSCQSTLYNIGKATCASSSQLSSLQNFLILVLYWGKYFAIGLFIIYILININRVLSINAKRTIDVFQLLSLLALYKYHHTSIVQETLKITQIFNFSIFKTLICDQQITPYGCYGYQNIIGIFLTLIFFLILFLFGYCIAGCLYSLANPKQNNLIYVKPNKQSDKLDKLTFGMYFKNNWRSFVLLYLDLTIIQTTTSLTQIVVTSNYVFFIIAIFLILVFFGIKLYLNIINDVKQTTLMYRAKHLYFYVYDQMYHLNYIDHITIQNQQNNLKNPFYPKSNMVLMEILLKMVSSSLTVLLYQYEAYLFTILLLIIVLIYFFNMKIFFYYQKSNFYYFLMTYMVNIFSVSTFYYSFFQFYFVCFILFFLIILSLSILFSIINWSANKQGQMLKKSYQLHQKQKRVSNDPSQDQIIFQNNQPSVKTNQQLENSQNLIMNLKRMSKQQFQSQNKQKSNNNIPVKTKRDKSISKKTNLLFNKSSKRQSKNIQNSIQIQQLDNIS